MKNFFGFKNNKSKNFQLSSMNRENTLKLMSKYFCKCLNVIDLTDEIMFMSLKEGLTKFLSNCYIALRGRYNTDYYTEAALEQIKNKNYGNLIFEHIVPKNIYQNAIINSAIAGKQLTEDEIYNILNKYWWVATVTKAEDKILTHNHLRTSMPKDWDNKDIFARYKFSNIDLITK